MGPCGTDFDLPYSALSLLQTSYLFVSIRNAGNAPSCCTSEHSSSNLKCCGFRCFSGQPRRCSTFAISKRITFKGMLRSQNFMHSFACALETGVLWSGDERASRFPNKKGKREVDLSSSLPFPTIDKMRESFLKNVLVLQC